MDKYQPYLDWIDKQKDAMVDLVVEWANINSGSLNLEGLEKMSQCLEGIFGVLSDSSERIPLPPQRILNHQGQWYEQKLGTALLFKKRPNAPIKILLGGHMDTVFDQDHPFQTVEFLDANTLHGPGVADLKGGLVVIYHALMALEKTPHASNVGWEVFINPDEEIGSHGSANFLRDCAKRNHFGLIVEPALSDGTLAGQRKGSGNFYVLVHGKSAHAGREPHLGRNAIVLASELVTRMNEWNDQKAGLSVNVGLIQGGGALNRVPDFAMVGLNVRMQTSEDASWIETQLQQLVQEFNARDGYTIELEGKISRPPKTMTEQITKLFEGLQKCGDELEIPIHWTATGGVCDGNNLAYAGLPNIDTMGVRGGKIHTDEEFLMIESLPERAKLMALFLMKLAHGEWFLSDFGIQP